MENKEFLKINKSNATENRQAEYEPPEIKTFSEEEIIEQIGPAQACSPSPCITSL